MLWSLSTCAQIITGTVYRGGTDSTIAKASIYYNGSTNGTISNAHGYFQIVQQAAKIPIVVSCIGYYSAIVENYSPTTPVKVFLKPKVNELGGVTIRVKSGIGRADMERMFFKIFIGTSDNASSCTIINIDDLDLFYSSKTETLIATCNKPIEIDNKKLAYHISYYLDKFKATRRTAIYEGNSQFTDLATAANQKKVSQNRETAYDGSRMEFIRALHSNTLARHGFKIYTPWVKPMVPDSIVTLNSRSEQFINLKYKVTIVHNGENWLASSLGQTIADCYIDKNGFYNSGLQWFGNMSTQRVGDMLPFDYHSAKDAQTGNAIALNSTDPVNLKTTKPDSAAYHSPKFHKEVQLLKTVVLVPNNALDTRLVVKKWQTAVRYKVYGSFGAAIAKNIDSTFDQIARLTGLQITKAKADSTANFLIVAGNLGSYAQILSPEALAYFKGNGNVGGAYYFAGDNGFSTMIQMVRPVPGVAMWPVVQKQIMRGLGFFGTVDGYSGSVFYDIAKATPLQLQTLDARIVKTFYDPQIKSGMTERQLDEVLTKINLEKL